MRYPGERLSAFQEPSAGGSLPEGSEAGSEALRGRAEGLWPEAGVTKGPNQSFATCRHREAQNAPAPRARGGQGVSPRVIMALTWENTVELDTVRPVWLSMSAPLLSTTAERPGLRPERARSATPLGRT
jgi:hypothetical protein